MKSTFGLQPYPPVVFIVNGNHSLRIKAESGPAGRYGERRQASRKKTPAKEERVSAGANQMEVMNVCA